VFASVRNPAAAHVWDIYRSTDRGATWSLQTLPAGIRSQGLAIISGTPNNVHVGSQAGIIRFDGTNWNYFNPGSEASILYLVGPDEGYYAQCNVWGQWNGATWQYRGNPHTTCDHHAIWGMRDAANVLHLYFSGNPGFSMGFCVWRFDPVAGSGYSVVYASGSDSRATAMWGSAPDDIYASGWLNSRGCLYHYDGTSWSRVTAIGNPLGSDGVTGTARDDVWVSFHDKLLHFTPTNLPPAIVIEPLPQTVVPGSNVTFSVRATGSQPLSYQWWKDGVTLVGRTAASLSWTSVQISDAGNYWAVVTNAAGSATSQVATLTVWPVATWSFAAPGRITVPSAGAAIPYPSSNLVAGVVGVVLEGTVTLSNVNHTYPDDLDILLVGPGGQSVMLMSDAGGPVALGNVTLTFNSAAANALPDSSQLTGGTWQPTDYEVGETLPAPAPPGPYGTNLAVFNGLDPNGAWRLFVYDDTGGDSGSIANGWGLRLTVAGPSSAPVFLPPRLDAGTIALRFETTAGRSYVVQYKDFLDDKAWQALRTAVGDGTVQTVQDAIAGSAQRFYRLRSE
jgi:subtilisin-like proprotein convertase family protein